MDLSALNGATTLLEAVSRLLDEAVKAATDSRRERGCMVAIGMLDCQPDHTALARGMTTRRNVLINGIAMKLQCWTSPDRAAALARYLSAVLQGLSVQARDGATMSELQLVAAQVVTGLAAQEALPQIAATR
ncbi:hypothetical protein ACAX43_27185 [Paraburkholderia sp. IW21]|uniref:hypothetical protein n=1 Tax=Paraburkholderia sp. IW21 TaxID=3242488 RepID=UPI003521E2F2